MSPRIRTYNEVNEIASDLPEQVAAGEARVASRLASVGHVIGIMSGKGGVGKSLITALLAAALAQQGRRVGLLDADLNGPSATRLLGVASRPIREGDTGFEPIQSEEGVRIMSMALLLKPDTALKWRDSVDAGFVWRGAQEREAIREFLADVAWGELDLLLVDLPPGTQRLAELHALVPELSGVLTVTIPSAASRDAVARALDLARDRGVRLLGLVENMAGVRCADCGAIGSLHSGAAGADLAKRFDIPLLARLPFDSRLGEAADRGEIEGWLAEDDDLGAELHRLAATIYDGSVSEAAT